MFVLLCGDGYYKLDFAIRKGSKLTDVVKNFMEELDSSFTKRDGNGTLLDLENESAFYIASLSIGTPASEVKVLVDTGSADLWVMSSKNSYCSSNGGSMDCSTYGTYSEDNSTTFESNNSDFSISYLDQTFAKGTWGQDTVELTDDLVIEGANFAVADSTDSNVGVLGIAYTQLESADTVYDNLPVQMKQQGFIKKVAYSMYLTSAERNTGSVLFGAIDHAKYTGDLVSFDVVPKNGQNVYLQITLSNIQVTLVSNSTESSSVVPTTLASSVTSSTSPHPTIAAVLKKREATIDTQDVDALFDSGTTLTYFSQDVLDSILAAIDPSAEYNSNIGGYQVPCSLRQEGNKFTYNFDGKREIDVPLSDMVMEVGQNGTTGQIICMLGIVSGDTTILGDNFMRHCYSVFDLEDNTVSIAQMNYDDINEDIEIIQ
ncbi:Candidapepsin-7 [Yamadazyma tenuis]|uniref:Candidapepsin-7 n=1 Tax=Candida tenuis TaxID=2315449 RepID=UPI0027AB0F46|nr:Candidapepsin-7 [Yamadazyma tenuis]